MTWDGKTKRRVRVLKRRLRGAWSNGLIAAVLVAIVAILIAWANVTGR